MKEQKQAPNIKPRYLLPWVISNQKSVILVINKHKLPGSSLRIFQQSFQVK